MTYQSASGAGAQNMRELLVQMGEAHMAAREPARGPVVGDPRHRSRGGRHPARPELPEGAFRRPARRQPHSLDRPGHGRRNEPRGVEGRRGDEQDPRPRPRVGQACDPGGFDLRAHRRDALPQPGADHQAHARHPACRDRGDARRRQRMGARHSQHLRRQRPAAHAGGGDRDRSRCRSAGCASLRWAANTSARSPSATNCYGVPPSRLRRMVRILLGR